MSSSTGIWDKLNGRETKWPTVRDAGLFLKTSVQFGKWPLPRVGSPAHSAKEHTFSSLWVSHRTVLPNSSSFCFFSRAPQTEMSAAGHPLSVRRKRHRFWLFHAGLKQSQNVGLGQKGIKTLFRYMLPCRFWSSQIWNKKVEVRAQMQNWQTAEGVTWGNKQLHMLTIPRATLIFINKDFSRVWWTSLRSVQISSICQDYE